MKQPKTSSSWLTKVLLIFALVLASELGAEAPNSGGAESGQQQQELAIGRIAEKASVAQPLSVNFGQHIHQFALWIGCRGFVQLDSVYGRVIH